MTIRHPLGISHNPITANRKSNRNSSLSPKFYPFSRGFNKQPPEVLLNPQLLLPHQGNCLLANETSKILDLQGIMGCPVFPQNCVLFVFPSHLPNCPGNSG